MEKIESHPQHLAAQLFSMSNIPDRQGLGRQYEWGFAEAFWLDVPDSELYLLDAYALGLMHRLANGDYSWADRDASPRAAVAKLIADFVGTGGAAGVSYHNSRYFDLLREAWSLGAGQSPRIEPAGWRRKQALADAYYSVRGQGAQDDRVASREELRRAVALAFSAWGGEAIPEAILEGLGAVRISAADWAEAWEDLRLDNPESATGALMRLLAFAYDLGHPADTGTVAATVIPPPSGERA